MGSSKTLLLIACALMGAAFAAQEQRCREGWELFQGSCYRVYEFRLGNYWSDAKENCYYNDGYLAELTSEDESTFVKGLVTKAIPEGDGKSVWFGARYDGNLDGWQWFYSRDTYDYTEIETTDARKAVWESRRFTCGSLDGSDGWSWKDGSCRQPKDYYVCERCLLQEVCSGGSCYTLPCHLDDIRGSDAKKQCGREGGYLAEITTAEEHTVVKEFLRTANIPDQKYYRDPSVKAVLIGGTDMREEGNWVWHHSGDKIDLDFPGWGTDQPEDWGVHGSHENCLALNRLDDFSFDDVMCSEELPYLCERPETQDSGIVG